MGASQQPGATGGDPREAWVGKILNDFLDRKVRGEPSAPGGPDGFTVIGPGPTGPKDPGPGEPPHNPRKPYRRPLECDTGNPCIAGDCVNGYCQRYFLFATSCNDGDGDPCTVGRCWGGVCVAFPINCGDGNPCTRDWCEGPGTCKHGPASGAPCADDGDPCTNNMCANDVCTHQEMRLPAYPPLDGPQRPGLLHQYEGIRFHSGQQR